MIQYLILIFPYLILILLIHSVSGGRGMMFVSSARQGGQLLNFKSQRGDTFRGEEDGFRQSSRGGGLLYHDELLVFP